MDPQNKSWYSLGNYLIKKNHTCFGKEGPVIKITAHYHKFDHHVINGVFILKKHLVKVIPERSANKIVKFWERCNHVAAYIPVPGRHPCYREDNITRKVIIKDEDRQNALYRIIKKTGDQRFEIYKCSGCQNFHLGRNPYVHHSPLLSKKK
jgi:hypothetical protein